MWPLVSTLGPVFGIVIAGFAARRVGLVGARVSKALVLVAFNAALPILLFRSMARLELPDAIEWKLLAAFYGAAFVCYGSGIALAALVFHRPRREWAAFGMGSGFSNTVLLGIPVLLGAFGEAAMLPAFMIIAFHSMTLLPASVLLLQWTRDTETGRRPPAVSIAREIVLNPIVLGLALGLAANRAGLVPAGGLDVAAAGVAAAAIPCALLALGTSLAGYPVSRDRVAPALTIAGLKLVVQPAVAWVIAVPLLGLGWPWAPVAVVMAAMPSGAMVYLFAARYEGAPNLAALAVLVASALSVATVPLWLAWVGP